MYDYIIIGAGIVGLSVAKALQDTYPDRKIAILEKESGPAKHQTGHNSGVVHSGIYYQPGSLKAQLAKKGNETLYAFCQQHDLYYDRCGKVIVATTESELPQLNMLHQRGLENGLELTKLSLQQLKEREPYVDGIAGLFVPSAGIVNYRQISEKLAQLIQQNDGHIFYDQRVEKITETSSHVDVTTHSQTYQAKWLINCAGLFCDRIAALAGYDILMKIIPFRGEYYVLNQDKEHLVNHLIYPVPNPDFPFLGVHFTRMHNGKRDVGPNAVLAFKREGYKKTDLNVKDLYEVLTYPGFWKIAKNYLAEGMAEMHRSFSKKRFVENACRLIPSLEIDDFQPGPTGVRAQALTLDGKLVDDFHLFNGKRSLHVCNAPSPAATASLEIGREIVLRHFT